MGYWRDLGYEVFDASLARHLPTRRLVNQRRLRFAVQRRLGDLMPTPPAVELEYTSDLNCSHDGEVSRVKGGFRMRQPVYASRTNWQQARHYGLTYLYWLSRCPPEVEAITCTFGDGNDPSEGRFAPSTNLPGIVALPDPYFLDARGFGHWLRLSERSTVGWADRSSDLVWRGATWGFGSSDPAVGLAHPEMATQRLALCLALRGLPGTDAKFSVATDGTRMTTPYLGRFGVGDAHVAEESWLGRKFAFDVDGNTNTWSNLIIRLHLGCCVLKVASRYGYRQWYYDRLKPWEHYVPVSADLSDLMERIEWVRANDREASEIARRGQAFARTLTWDAVEAEAVELITANWNRPQAG